MNIIVTLVVGLIVGALAKLVMPGKDPGGAVITMLLGVAERSSPPSPRDGLVLARAGARNHRVDHRLADALAMYRAIVERRAVW
jgi:hypothetical protein